MSLFRRSLLDVDSLSLDAIQQIFSTANHFTNGKFDAHEPFRSREYVVPLLFFEPSTRTRMSFETAAWRLGVGTLRLDDYAGSSLVKGETLKDTLLNVIAMNPQAIVLRYGMDAELTEYLPTSPVPILVAGYGTRSHPTQALLDAFTILKVRGQVQGERVLIVGDVAHSRVAHSNLTLLKKLGAQVGVCGPSDLIQLAPDVASGVQVFSRLDEGLRWASVCMTLRIQLERIAGEKAKALDRGAYRAEYGFTPERMQGFARDGIILHPGPINQNVEMDSAVLQDPRCQVLTQVGHGVAIRASLLAHCLGLKGIPS